jgi:glycosyltransferase involved in cell wall biosynthesis
MRGQQVVKYPGLFRLANCGCAVKTMTDSQRNAEFDKYESVRIDADDASAADRLRVLFINNYPMDVAYRRCLARDYPSHHLWGVTELARHGISVLIPSHVEYHLYHLRFWKPILPFLTLLIYIIQQIKACLLWKEYDVLYSACGWNFFLLSILRRMGLFRKPIVAVYHHPVRRSPIAKLIIGGIDRCVFISKSVRDDFMTRFDLPEERTHVLSWGFDASYYETGGIGVKEPKGRFIVSAGKTHRDYNTLVKAFRDVNCTLKIYCSGDTAPDRSLVSENVKVVYSHPLQAAIPYNELLREYRSAYAIAIPLTSTGKLMGLTGLLDALVLGKPLIMTRNACIDVDIEAEGVGIWVAPGDVEGWKRAVNRLLENPDKAKEMGERGKELVSRKLSIANFGADLARILKSVHLESRLVPGAPNPSCASLNDP